MTGISRVASVLSVVGALVFPVIAITCASRAGAATQSSPVHLPAPPKGGDDLALNNARKLLSVPTPRTRANNFRSQTLDLTTLAIRPLTATYAIAIADLAQGKDLDAATPQNKFEYAARVAGQVRGIATVEFTATSAGRFLGFVSDDPAGLVEGIDALAGFEKVRGGSFEVRKLMLPPTSDFPHPTQVLWLKSDKGAGDLVYTLKEPSYPATLKKQTLYTADDFVKVLRPWAGKATRTRRVPAGKVE